jgi:hypothetical protein
LKVICMFAASALALSMYAGSAVAGGHPHDHNGFFLGFNLGGGTADMSVPGAGNSDRQGGGVANLRIGGAIKNNLLIGAETSGWARNENNTTVSLSTLVFAATYYPGSEGFFLRGGAGFGGASTEKDLGNDETQSKHDTGFALSAAAGYEWRLTKKFALGPQVEFVYLNIGGDLVDTANFFDATLGFNWYW